MLTVFETARFIKSGGNPNAFVDYARPYFSLCLSTTLMATLLIVVRIVWVSRGNKALGFSGYRAVIEMVVESAFLYSATLIVYIALLFGSTTTDNDGYAQAVLIEMTVCHTYSLLGQMITSLTGNCTDLDCCACLIRAFAPECVLAANHQTQLPAHQCHE